MKFKISKASDYNSYIRPSNKAYQETDNNDHINWFVDINSLEDLINLIKEVNEDIVIYQPWNEGDLYEIQIYDDHIE